MNTEITNQAPLHHWARSLAFGATLLASAAQASPVEFANEVLADSPVGYWRLSEAPGSSRAVDASAEGRDGDYSTSSIEFNQTGLFGGDTGVYFDGSGPGRVVVPDAPALNPAHVTMEALVQWDGPNGFQQRILEKSADGGGYFPVYGFSIDDAGQVMVEISGTCMSIVLSNGALVEGAPTHVAASFDGRVIRIYIDGALDVEEEACAPSDLTTSAWDLALGNQAPRDRAFHGTIDEVALYGHALSPERVEAHYAALFGEPCDLRVETCGLPSAIERSETLVFDAHAYNDCDSGRSVDRVDLVVSGPAGLTLPVYDGSPVEVPSGGDASAPVRLKVPMGAPLGPYTVAVVLYRDGQVVDSSEFEVEVR